MGLCPISLAAGNMCMEPAAPHLVLIGNFLHRKLLYKHASLLISNLLRTVPTSLLNLIVSRSTQRECHPCLAKSKKSFCDG